jgi:hypothetical protein
MLTSVINKLFEIKQEVPEEFMIVAPLHIFHTILKG